MSRPMVCPYCGDPTVPYGGEDICECALSSCCGQPVDVACDCDRDDLDDDESEWTRWDNADQMRAAWA